MPEPKSGRKACLIIAVLVSPIILSFIVIIGLAAYVLMQGTPLKGLVLDEPEAGEYSPEVVQIRTEVDAELEAARKQLDQDLANLPPDCPLPQGWRLETMLANAWLPVEEGTLADLEGAVYDQLLGDEEDLQETFEELASRIGTAREAGNATVLERRFDPNVRTREEVLAEFRDYILHAEYLDQLATAIDCGVARHVPEKPFDLDDDTAHRLRTAAWLLKLRGLYALQEDNLERALETTHRLVRLSASGTVPHAPYWYREYLVRTADMSLALVMSYGEIPEPWPARLEQEYRQRFAGYDVRAELLVQALAAPHVSDFMPFFDKVSQTNRLCEGIKTATDSIQPPLVDCRGEIQALLAEYGVGSLEDDKDRSAIAGVFEALRMNPAEMIVGTELEMTLDDAPGVYRLVFMNAVVQTAAALEYSYRKHGTYPEKLDALVPEFLPEVPVDPVFGEPIGYTLDETGYELTLRRASQFSWTEEKDYTPDYPTVWKVRKGLFTAKDQ